MPDYKLQDLIDIEQFQSLQDRLNEIYSFPSAIIDNDGNVLTATAWQDICTKFHRVHPLSEKECRVSDRYILDHIHEAKPAVSYQCPHGLIDNATPIIINGIHYGNFFTGQFFLEAPDLNFFRAQAGKYGFDEEAYLQAVKKVPVWNKEQLNNYLYFIKGLIEVISGIGLKNLKEIETGKMIKESEEQFRTIFELAPNGMLLLGIDGKFIKVNRAFCSMIGYTKEEVKSMTFGEITHPDDLSESNEWVTKLLNNEVSTIDFEKRCFHKSGRIIWAYVRAMLKRDDEGSPQYFITHIQDITGSKRADEELKKSEALYHDLVETAQDLIWQCDAEGRYIYLNPAWEDVFGYRVEEMLGKKFTDFQTAEWAERDLKEFERLLNGDTVKGLETVHIGKDGRDINLLFNAKYVHDNKGTITGTRGTAFDISGYRRTEQALTESENKYSSLFNSMNEGVVLHRIMYNKDRKPVDYRIIESNPAFERHTGIEADKSNNQLASEFYDSGSAPYLDVYAGVAETGIPTHFETYFPPLEKHFDISVFSPEKGWFATIFTDITEQVNSKKKLEESENRFRSIIENTEAGYFFIDKEGIIRNVNHAWVKLYKYNSPEEIIGKHFAEVQRLDDLKSAEELVNGIMLGNEGFMRGEFSRKCKDGSVGYHSFSARPIRNEEEVIGIEGFIIDITDRIIAQEKIREKDIQFRKLSANVPDLIFQFTRKPDGTYCVPIASEGIRNIFGCTPEDVVDDFSPIARVLHPEDTARVISDIEYSANHLTYFTCEFRVQIPGKPVQWIYSRSSPEKLEDGSITWYGFNADITQLKQVEEEIQELNQQLELRVAQRTAQLLDVNKELESFVYSVSHDLRAPLRSIMGFSEIISTRHKDSLNEEGIQYFGYILEASKNMANLIEDLLHFSRLTRYQIAKEMISLDELIDAVIKSLHQDIQDKQARIVLPEKMPAIPGDRSLLTQVFTNLFHNAILYRQKGINPEVILSVEESEKNFIISVKDNGEGIPKEHHEKIFKIFQRLHTNEEFPGTGIGLSIVKKAVTALGGEITLESEVNAGSTFFVTLPKVL